MNGECFLENLRLVHAVLAEDTERIRVADVLVDKNVVLYLQFFGRRIIPPVRQNAVKLFRE